MTAAVTQSLLANLSGTYSTPATVFGAIAIGLLTILMVEKEILRAWNPEKAKVWFRALDIAILPLMIVFFIVVVIRTLFLIHL